MTKLATGVSILGLLLVAGCGGGGSSPNSPSQQPYTQTVTGSVGVFGTNSHSIGPAPRGGNMTITLTWSNSADLDLYLTNSGCSEFNVIATCQLFGSADGFVNPERVQRTVSSGDSFRLFVDNNSTTLSVNYTLTIRIE